MSTIYRNQVNEITTYTTTNFEFDNKHAETYLKFEINEELVENATKCLMTSYVPNSTFSLVKIQDYYIWMRWIDEWEPIELNGRQVWPFDKNNRYPMQHVEMKLDWVY